MERDVFYSGNPIQERCTVVCRLAPTFWRFGTFQICNTVNPLTGVCTLVCFVFGWMCLDAVCTNAVYGMSVLSYGHAYGPCMRPPTQHLYYPSTPTPPGTTTGRAGPSPGQGPSLLPGMIDYCIRTHFPHIWASYHGDALENTTAKEDMYVAWLTEVVKRSAALVAGWESVGFTHGMRGGGWGVHVFLICVCMCVCVCTRCTVYVCYMNNTFAWVCVYIISGDSTSCSSPC